MKKLLTTLIGLAAFNALADVIIYDNHLSYTTTGALRNSRMLGSGWTVLDVQNGVATQLILVKSQGLFYILSPSIEIRHFTTAPGKDMMVVYVQPVSGSSGLGIDVSTSSGLGIASGVSTSLNSGTQSYTGAKTLMLRSSYVNVASDVISNVIPNVYLETAQGSLTFDSETTVNQNQIDGNYTNTVQRLTQRLLSEGYTPAPHLVTGHVPAGKTP